LKVNTITAPLCQWQGRGRNQIGLTVLPSLHIKSGDRLDYSALIRSIRVIAEVAVRHVASRLSSLLPGPSPLHRLVAIICATAFLAVSFAHCLHHFGTSVPTVVSQSDAESPAPGPDSPNNASGDVYHCHGCTMLATLVEESASATLIAAKFPLFRLDSGPAHRAVVEPPPPKFAI
jgi:hypothetical protein